MVQSFPSTPDSYSAGHKSLPTKPNSHHCDHKCLAIGQYPEQTESILQLQNCFPKMYLNYIFLSVMSLSCLISFLTLFFKFCNFYEKLHS
jgi:hypothetical protein